MSRTEFVDYYELLEASPTASIETIESIFRSMAKRYHPDTAESGDVKKFSILTDAYKTLTDENARMAYDAKYRTHKRAQDELVEETTKLGDDAEDRRRLLSLFYAQRRKNMKQPGIGGATLQEIMGLPGEVLDFHLWYFRQKGWIQREESGPMSITSEGVDQIETNLRQEEDNRIKRITVENNLLLKSGRSEANA